MEDAIHQWLQGALPTAPHLILGPGDDAAVLDWSDAAQCLVASDTIVQDLDFTLPACPLTAVGHKALAVNLSDIAAMAGIPVSATVSLVLPQDQSEATTRQLIEGMLPLANRHNLVISGGDISIWNGPLIITVTILGKPGAAGVLTRDNASAGDQLFVTGTLGGSLLGHHLIFEPRLKQIHSLAADFSIRAAMDISDGLSLDAMRLAQASGVGVVLDLDAIPISDAAHTRSAEPHNARSPLDHALGDGEDFELLLAVSPSTADQLPAATSSDCPLTRIGYFCEKKGLYAQGDNSHPVPLAATGYLHGKAGITDVT